ncbi:tryptophan--tRNA ligase [Longispora albida]|uniref:tryptophan--tRNA ligase n=1 Tax=Longispora albida TaxID=203523 RepID=UPI00035DE53D|nr:tryptophan--tRNA ligase [Longispora albida]
MSRLLTGFKPTGHMHLGNLLGAIRPIVARQDGNRTTVMIVDLHAMTVPHTPATLRELSMEVAGLLLASGVDASQFYLQSQVPEHTELHYLLECVTSYGEAHRMIQFKEKGGSGSRLALLTYPVLMAADILLHDTDEVPVGEDQLQHIELTRSVAQRFNNLYGTTFAVPKGVSPLFAARVMDLSDPARKMGKTGSTDTGSIRLLDEPEVIRRKVMRAVTDTLSTVHYDPAEQPGVSNLLSILAGCTGRTPGGLAGQFTTYGGLKEAVADAVVEVVRPIQERYAELDPGQVRKELAAGAEQAREVASVTVRRAKQAIGLVMG